MAKLKNDHGSEFLVPCRCLIGRSGLAHLRLGNRRVSSEHCLVYWEHQGWRVRDLGSRNGSSVNGRSLTPGQARSLQVGDALRPGGSHAEPPSFRSQSRRAVNVPENLPRGRRRSTARTAISVKLRNPDA